MLYRKDRYGNELSQLGYGCMRFTRGSGGIDIEKAKQEILCAYENGVNYYDTAYIYPGSEEALGRILEETRLRDKVHVATKLPHYNLRSIQAVEKTFREELRRLRTDYIDYYLMHMFTDVHEWENLKAMGIEQWIDERKKEGSIRQIGFSYHGDTEMFLKILNAYDWDFCQIQYNYLDEDSQAGRAGLKAAHEKGLPVIIMEPLRGGKLIDLPSKGLRIIEMYKHQFRDLNDVIAQIKNRNYKFIIYMDDLSFEDFEIEYKYLKAVIEGGLERKPDNVLIYATSNRRHLIREKFSDKADRDDELHTNDTVQEKLSLASRFGVTIFFRSPDKKEFEHIVTELAKRNGVSMPEEELLYKANQWELYHGGLSGRTAAQFIDYLCGVTQAAD